MLSNHQGAVLPILSSITETGPIPHNWQARLSSLRNCQR